MQIHRTISSLRQSLKNAGIVAFAPTMGNLHEGHASLMRAARESGANTVVASIFVNRLQFGPREDFAAYPRTFDNDCAKLREVGVDHLFAPDENELYPTPQTYFVLPPQEQDTILEGTFRPGHFRGVATVVAKLFNIVQPHTAFFGKKDYQQLMVIRNMVRELAMPIKIVGCDTIRAQDGLALSSRNGYLSEPERTEAARLNQELRQIVEAVCSGARNFSELETKAEQALAMAGWSPDYISVRRQLDLQAPQNDSEPLVVLGAAKLGTTRLIDNIEV